MAQKDMPSLPALNLIYTRQPENSDNAFNVPNLQQYLHNLLRSRLLHIPTHHVHRMDYLIALPS